LSEKIILFVLLFLLLAEGIYYWWFSSLAFSLGDLSIGWGQIIQAVIEETNVLDVWSRVEAYIITLQREEKALSGDIPISEISPNSLNENEL
jgi:hypothetical protein